MCGYHAARAACALAELGVVTHNDPVTQHRSRRSSLRARERSPAVRLADAYELLSELDAEAASTPMTSPTSRAHATGPGAWTSVSTRTPACMRCTSTRARARRRVVASTSCAGTGTSSRPAVAKGWLRRAERLLEDDRDCREYGYLQLRLAHARSRPATSPPPPSCAEREELGRRFGDRDLELLALHDHGLALVARGEVEEGFACIDEAAAGAVGGELGPVATAIVYCNTIGACRDVGDYRRAGDWTEATKRWCDRQTINGFPGMCRVYRAEVMRLRGDWVTAHEDAQLACVELREWSPAVAGRGVLRARGDPASHRRPRRRRAGIQAGARARPRARRRACVARARAWQCTRRCSACRPRAGRGDADRFARARLLPTKIELALALGRVRRG